MDELNKNFIVITAQIIDNRNTPVAQSVSVGYAYSSDFCTLLLGVISRICGEMNVEIIKSECFEKESRMALVVQADADHATAGLDVLRAALELAGTKLNATIRVQKTDLFRYMHRI